jgi:hypothetical protein
MNRPIAAWHRFWFEPQETSSLALFRIAFGLVATGWTATQGPNLFAFYGPDGVLPDSSGTGSWGLLDLSDEPGFLVGVFVATLAGSLALTLGLFTRLAAVVLWAGVVSFEHRNGLVANSGDGLVRNLAFLCVLAPCGEALSLDRLRRDREHFWEFPARAPWALRLVQIQLSVGYLSAFWAKSGNPLWREGTAVAYSLRIADIHRIPTPDAVADSVLLMNVLTYGTLAVELSLGLLIWNRTLRPWLLLAGIGLHLSIDISIMVGFFSLAMITAYLSFVSPRTATHVVLAVRDRSALQAQRVRGRLGRQAAAPRPAALGAAERTKLG